LTDEGLLANGLSHSLRLCELRRRACRRYAGTCAHSYPARAAADRGVGWRMHRFAPARLCGAIPSIHVRQCRVPPSPPAIRDMKKPRLRIRRGFDFLDGRLGRRVRRSRVWPPSRASRCSCGASPASGRC
jgi:hypothetical protein